MSETAVALLFDDVELGSHLREALRERGARIVHEGTLGALSREALVTSGAEVVVLNLDDDALDGMDHLYEVIDGDHPRVVFNDAQASRGLDGWDRARWARHLAAKVLAVGDLDPPRPAAAPAYQSPPAETDTTAAAPEPVPSSFDTGLHDNPTVARSETLAAELEALLAAGEQQDIEPEFGHGLNYAAGEHMSLQEGDFIVEPVHADVAAPQALDADASGDFESLTPDRGPVVQTNFQLDHLALAPMDETFTAHGIKTETVARDFDLADSWSLVNEDTPATSPASATAVASPAEFGIEKVSAVDYLAPESGEGEHELEPGLSLELVSIEEAIAPQPHVAQAIVLDDLNAAISRVLLIGAAADSGESVDAFLRALPIGLRMAVIYIQHHAAERADEVSARIAGHVTLPIRRAGRDSRLRAGELLFVPAGQQVRLLRDGTIEAQAVDADAPQQPSIDTGFTMAANTFGRDAIAIVFAGHATDGVAGAQAVHDRGGQVWVEAAPGDHYAGMVRGIEAERLVSFSGTPQELAARLSETFA